MPRRSQAALAHLLTICLFAPLVAANGHKSKPARHKQSISKQFVIDPNRPFAYLRFDHVGQGHIDCYDEPTRRVWLHLVNNSRVPISIHASGLPENCNSDEVAIMFEVVPNLDSAVVLIEAPKVPSQPLTFPATSVPHEEPPPRTDRLDELDSEAAPHGNMLDVSTAVVIQPGKSIPISLPISHLGKRRQQAKNWHVEIPFEFDLPKGKGPRSPDVGGQPSMVVIYSIWDMPDDRE